MADRHPIEDPSIQADVKKLTAELLAKTGGSGQVTVEFDYKDNKIARVHYLTKQSANKNR